MIQQYDLFTREVQERSKRPYVKQHIVLTTYDMIIRDPLVFQNIHWESLIVDEGHRLKDRKSKLFQKLADIKQVSWKLLLTGTPLQNNIVECFNLMHFLDPIKFADLPGLEARYADLSKEKLAEIHELIRDHILRRTKAITLAGTIPDKVDVIVPVTMSPLQRDLYRKILTRNFAILRSSPSKYAKRTSLTNVVMELRKLLNHPYLIVGGEPHFPEGTDKDTIQQAMIQSCGKLYLLHHILRRLKERGSRVLLFSTMTKVLDVLEVPNPRVQNILSLTRFRTIYGKSRIPTVGWMET